MEKYLIRIIEGHYNSEDLNTTIKECMAVDVVGGENQVKSLMKLLRETANEANRKLTISALKEVSEIVEGETVYTYSIFESFKTALEGEQDGI